MKLPCVERGDNCFGGRGKTDMKIVLLPSLCSAKFEICDVEADAITAV